ncbi:hypothetical protein MBLNU13_g11503t1 [Cladosporium sp. NU13]
MASTTPQKKRGLSSLFGAKKNKDNDLSPNGANHALHPSTSTTGTAQQPDSAYASSNHPSSSSKRDSVANVNAESNNNADVVPVENTGKFEGVGPERNLAYNTSTGQVLDDDTGEVVVTTTTTTTTTMTTRGGKKSTKVEVHSQKDGQPTIAEAPGDMPSMSSTTSHSPVPPPRPLSGGMGNSSYGTPGPHDGGVAQSYTPPRNDPDTVPVPARNPMREREPMEPVSPLRPNFSYPSRTDIREDPVPQPAPKSTFANLKAAAQGLHGVGETVRGTLNNEIDTRFPRSNSQKAAAANAKNQSVLEAGNREMAGVSMRRSQDRRRSQEVPQAPQTRPSVAHEPMPQQLMPGPPPNHALSGPPSNTGPPANHLPHFKPPPPSGPPNESVGGFSNYAGTESSNEMSQVPPSFSPESSAPQQKQGGLRKLTKRRPVSNGHA